MDYMKNKIEFSTQGEHHYFKGEIILKNKYLLVGIDRNILLFDIDSGKQLTLWLRLVQGPLHLNMEM